ncbi:MAG: hypothetical protein E7352_00715 [Clostridiales bacterium]|nr:hypothetical protein [Clostridiales bacterium]
MRLREKNKRKTILLCAVIFISLCILFFIFFQPKTRAYATETSVQPTAMETDTSLQETIEEQLENLDLKALEEYLRSIGQLSNETLAQRLSTYVKGAKFDFSDFGNALLDAFLSKVTLLLPSFAVIAAITLLAGVMSTIKSNAGGQTASEMIFLITYAASMIPIFAVLLECFRDTIQCVGQMREQMQLIYPIMLTLMAASGGSVSASVCRPAVGFFSTSIVSIISGVVFPLTIAIIVLSMAGNLTKELKIGKFSTFFKSINKWIIGICVSVFGIFFTLQGITTAIYDGVVRRAAKYAIGNGIPIVGGFLSGGFDLAVAGSVLIKNSLGSMGIVMMLTVLIEPLVLLISTTVLLRLISAVTQPFGDSRISDFLGETADNLQYCTAGLLITAFLYFLTIVLMIYSTEALF